MSAAPWMFCTLFARYMPAISRAPSRPRVAVGSSIEATIVQPMSMSARDVLARVADEGGRRDRRRQAAVADLAGERLHLRRGAGDVDRRHLARRVRVRRRARAPTRSTSRPRTRTPRRRARRARSRRRPASARAASFVCMPRVVEEDLRGAEAEDEPPGPGRLLHDPRVHRDLHRMARERRDDPPADREPLRRAARSAPSTPSRSAPPSRACATTGRPRRARSCPSLPRP